MKRLLLISSITFLFLACENKNGANTADMNDKADSSKAEKVESKEDRNKKIVKDAMAALNDHNIEKMVALMSDDAVDYGDGMGRSVKGRDSIRANMTVFMNAFPDFKANELRYFADGDHVVVIGEYSGTFKNDLGKMKATNKSFRFPDADVFTLTDDGKISSHRYIQPDATLFGQVGVKPK
jgi:ketosteroid isomerase-like protein